MCTNENYNYTDDDDDEFYNYTFPVRLAVNQTISKEERLYHEICYVAKYFILPFIFGSGIVGNALNIFIFTRRKFRNVLDDIEKSATTGLVALAISDLLFCMVGFPEPFLMYGVDGQSDSLLEVIALYYKGYKQAFMNIFLLSSTWLIVVISIERYVAVVYPLKARFLVRVKRTILIDVMVYVISGVFNIPAFLKYKVVRNQALCANESVTYILLFTDMYISYPFIRQFYRILWTVFGTVVPLALLVICNVRLLVEVYRSRRRYAAEQRKYSTSKITFILIAVILLYLLLVCPSMLLTFFGEIVTSGNEISFFRYRIAITGTNLAQALNFAMNFLLYCVISKPFRESLRNQLSACTPGGKGSNATSNSTATTQKYYVVENNGKST